MSDLFDRVTEDQDPITKLASKIPGFDGYIERQTRRNADKLLRESMASSYEELVKRISDIQKDLVSSGEISVLDDLETAVTKLQTFVDKIRNASYGYSGFFDAVKINEDELAQIYHYDLSMLEMQEGISSAIDNIEQSIGSDGLPAAIRHLIGLSRDLVSAYEKRDEVVTAMG
ncbi:MAG: hypothetical protein DWQ07_03000 [Chloroflexi bacterium]|nr:MAG: hypothetical protein DWQ07_03000 [Chloroflexota bacterium]MBL1193532.1 hypothetical protein [Chloroflexota bacterium]NOH10823.1 hypothetical protein [Chloroflexota bacterium]